MGVGVFLQGKECDSLPEYYFGTALEKLGIEYKFHWQIGMAGVAGNVEVDFVVYMPGAIPVEIQGDYWHQKEEVIRDATIRQYFMRDPVVADSKLVDSIPKAINWIKRKLI